MERLVSGDLCLHRPPTLICIMSCLQGVGDVHPFVSERMICKYKCWQGITSTSNKHRQSCSQTQVQPKPMTWLIVPSLGAGKGKSSVQQDPRDLQ